MKTSTKILIGILIITTLIPVLVGVYCLFDQPQALQFFGLKEISPDLEKVFFVLGGFMLGSVVMPILAIVWLTKGKREGYVLAYMVGFIGFVRGILTLVNFNMYEIDEAKLFVTPLVIGLLIMALTFAASRNQVRN